MSSNKYVALLDKQRTDKDKIPYGVKKSMSVDKFIMNLVSKHVDNDDYKNYTYYVIVGLWYKDIKSNNNVFTNFPLIGVAEVDFIGLKYNFYNDDVLPSYLPVYGEANKNKVLKGINVKTLYDIDKLKENYGVKIIEYEITSINEGRFNYDKVIALDDDLEQYILANDKYKRLVDINTPVSYNDVYRTISTTYTVDCGLKHKLLKFTVEDNNKILLSNVYMFDRTNDTKLVRVFDKVLVNSVYKYKTQRTNISYKYSVPIELICIMFDKIISKNNDADNVDISPYKIIEKEKHYMLFGEDKIDKAKIM